MKDEDNKIEKEKMLPQNVKPPQEGRIEKDEVYIEHKGWERSNQSAWVTYTRSVGVNRR